MDSRGRLDVAGGQVAGRRDPCDQRPARPVRRSESAHRPAYYLCGDPRVLPQVVDVIAPRRLSSQIEDSMRARLLILSLALAVIGCSSPSAPEASKVPNDAVAIVGDDFRDAIEGMRHFSGYGDRARRVIRDRDTWTRVWLRVTTSASSRPLPQVDFDRHMIIFAAMGTKSTGGYQIEIAQLFRRGDDFYAVVRETSPGRGCGVTTAETAPVTAALVPRTPGRVIFVERSAFHHCR